MPRLIDKKAISVSVRAEIDVETELCQILKRFKSALRFKGNRSKETSLGLKCSAWKCFINFASKKISTKILGRKEIFKKEFDTEKF